MAFAAARTRLDCDRVFIWQRLRVERSSSESASAARRVRHRSTASPSAAAGLSGSHRRAARPSTGSSGLRRRRRRRRGWLQFVDAAARRSAADPHRLAGGGLFPYALDTTVTALKANGSPAFTWNAASPVVGARSFGRARRGRGGERVTVLDAHGKIVSVDLYASDVSAVGLVTKGQLVQRDYCSSCGAAPMPTSSRSRPTRTSSTRRARQRPGGTGSSCMSMRLPDGAQTARTRGRRGDRRQPPLRRQRSRRSRSERSVSFVRMYPIVVVLLRRARRPRARRPQGAHRQRGRAHAEPRPARGARLVRRDLRRRARAELRRARSRTGRCSATARTSFRDAPCSRRSAAGRRCRTSTSSRTRRCVRRSGATTAGG